MCLGKTIEASFVIWKAFHTDGSKMWLFGRNFNPLPSNKILNVIKLKALDFADNKLNVAKMTISLLGRLQNTVGKGENAGYKHFLLFPVFSKVFFRVVKGWNCVVNT